MCIVMIKQMTVTDIVRLGKSVGIEFSAQAASDMNEHLNCQLFDFERLEKVDTCGVQPTFDLFGEGKNKIARRSE